MKDITRIHLAKVPYNIELEAKKQLETYIRSLESYSVESEVLEDIEIRMTELLSERGVIQDNVISTADIDAIKHQLGEPKDFAEDAMVADTDVIANAGRSLYRDIDTAVLGGVLAGIAKYLRVNVIWVRLLFIVAALFSFGIFALLYVVAWMVIPPARTAAEKLQLSGKPVTLSSIKALNDLGETGGERRATVIKRALTLFAGFAFVAGALGSIALMVAAAMSLSQLDGDTGYYPDMQVPLIFAFASGVLLTVLFLLGAFASFTQKINKQIIIAAVAIVILGIGTFGTAIGSMIYEERQAYALAERNRTETRVALPEALASVETIRMKVPDAVSVEYQVVEGNEFSARQTGLKGSPIAEVTLDGTTMNLTMKDLKRTSYGQIESLIIKGPKLSKLIVERGVLVYNGLERQDIVTESLNASSLSLGDSEIAKLTANLNDTASLSGDGAAITTVNADLKDRSSISLGTVSSLSIVTPEACGTDKKVSLGLRGVNGGLYQLNGKESSVNSEVRRACFDIQMSDYDREY